MTIAQFKAVAPTKAKADAAWSAFEAARVSDWRASRRAEVARVKRLATWDRWLHVNGRYLARLKALKDSL